MKTIRVNASRSYNVLIENGLLPRCGGILKGLLSPVGCERVVIVSDDSVWGQYGDSLAAALRTADFRVESFVFPHGEASKNVGTLSELLEFLARVLLTRTDALIAFGGGVVGDLAGFAAAVYLRGIRYVQIPTTLLAMVDSSVGGKTAVDLAAGKNLAGCFWQPSIVLVDPDLLDTLPPDTFSDGCAEVIKYGMIGDRALLSLLEQTGRDFPRANVIASCIADKCAAVEADETDNGVRRLLNFGHTAGHAIEVQSGFTVSHGQAVAMGMVLVTRAAAAEGLCSPDVCRRLENLLVGFGLPTEVPEVAAFSPEQLARAASADKKRTGDTLALILPRAAGKCEVLSRDADTLASFFVKGSSPVPDLSATDAGDGNSVRVTRVTATDSATVSAFPSKSEAHRALIAAALADRETQILCDHVNVDIAVTSCALAMLGARVTRTPSAFTVRPLFLRRRLADSFRIDIGESGSTLRFLMPLLASLGLETTVTMHGRLSERPISPLDGVLKAHGGTVVRNPDGTLTVGGRIRSGDYTIDGGVSSQFASGLLFALPLLDGDSTLTLTGNIESVPYLRMTLETLACFSIRIDGTEDLTSFRIAGNQHYRSPGSVRIGGDWSGAAFYLAAGAIGTRPVTVTGLNPASTQGDRMILELLRKMGAVTAVTECGVTVYPSPLHGITADVGDIPDLFPVLAVLGASASGETVLTGTERLRYKESDRIHEKSRLLMGLGVSAEEEGGTFRIRGAGEFCGTTVSAAGDHRIVMAAALAALRAAAPLRIKGFDAVMKSTPDFFKQFGRICEVKFHV